VRYSDVMQMPVGVVIPFNNKVLYYTTICFV